MVSSHEHKNTHSNHLNTFYYNFEEIKQRKFDGFIITGAPVEQMEYEAVDYWGELSEIFEWTKDNVTSTLHICWGAQAGLYHHYGIPKFPLSEKMFGLFEHKVMDRRVPLVRGFDDYFMVPHSRHTANRREDIEKIPELTILADSKEAGVYLVADEPGKKIFVMGHPEYNRLTLHNEYMRDKERGLNIQPPKNYYQNDNPSIRPPIQWRSHSNNLYTNWLNYYVYQQTPYEYVNMENIMKDKEI
jgi:homoserine O-succinyltransferase